MTKIKFFMNEISDLFLYQPNDFAKLTASELVWLKELIIAYNSENCEYETDEYQLNKVSIWLELSRAISQSLVNHDLDQVINILINNAVELLNKKHVRGRTISLLLSHTNTNNTNDARHDELYNEKVKSLLSAMNIEFNMNNDRSGLKEFITTSVDKLLHKETTTGFSLVTYTESERNYQSSGHSHLLQLQNQMFESLRKNSTSLNQIQFDNGRYIYKAYVVKALTESKASDYIRNLILNEFYTIREIGKNKSFLEIALIESFDSCDIKAEEIVLEVDVFVSLLELSSVCGVSFEGVDTILTGIMCVTAGLLSCVSHKISNSNEDDLTDVDIFLDMINRLFLSVAKMFNQINLNEAYNLASYALVLLYYRFVSWTPQYPKSKKYIESLFLVPSFLVLSKSVLTMLLNLMEQSRQEISIKWKNDCDLLKERNINRLLNCSSHMWLKTIINAQRNIFAFWLHFVEQALSQVLHAAQELKEAMLVKAEAVSTVPFVDEEVDGEVAIDEFGLNELFKETNATGVIASSSPTTPASRCDSVAELQHLSSLDCQKVRVQSSEDALHFLSELISWDRNFISSLINQSDCLELIIHLCDIFDEEMTAKIKRIQIQDKGCSLISSFGALINLLFSTGGIEENRLINILSYFSISLDEESHESKAMLIDIGPMKLTLLINVTILITVSSLKSKVKYTPDVYITMLWTNLLQSFEHHATSTMADTKLTDVSPDLIQLFLVLFHGLSVLNRKEAIVVELLTTVNNITNSTVKNPNKPLLLSRLVILLNYFMHHFYASSEDLLSRLQTSLFSKFMEQNTSPEGSSTCYSYDEINIFVDYNMKYDYYDFTIPWTFDKKIWPGSQVDTMIWKRLVKHEKYSNLFSAVLKAVQVIIDQKHDSQLQEAKKSFINSYYGLLISWRLMQVLPPTVAYVRASSPPLDSFSQLLYCLSQRFNEAPAVGSSTNSGSVLSTQSLGSSVNVLIKIMMEAAPPSPTEFDLSETYNTLDSSVTSNKLSNYKKWSIGDVKRLFQLAAGMLQEIAQNVSVTCEVPQTLFQVDMIIMLIHYIYKTYKEDIFFKNSSNESVSHKCFMAMDTEIEEAKFNEIMLIQLLNLYEEAEKVLEMHILDRNFVSHAIFQEALLDKLIVDIKLPNSGLDIDAMKLLCDTVNKRFSFEDDNTYPVMETHNNGLSQRVDVKWILAKKIMVSKMLDCEFLQEYDNCVEMLRKESHRRFTHLLTTSLSINEQGTNELATTGISVLTLLMEDIRCFLSKVQHCVNTDTTQITGENSLLCTRIVSTLFCSVSGSVFQSSSSNKLSKFINNIPDIHYTLAFATKLINFINYLTNDTDNNSEDQNLLNRALECLILIIDSLSQLKYNGTSSTDELVSFKNGSPIVYILSKLILTNVDSTGNMSSVSITVNYKNSVLNGLFRLLINSKCDTMDSITSTPLCCSILRLIIIVMDLYINTKQNEKHGSRETDKIQELVTEIQKLSYDSTILEKIDSWILDLLNYGSNQKSDVDNKFKAEYMALVIMFTRRLAVIGISNSSFQEEIRGSSMTTLGGSILNSILNLDKQVRKWLSQLDTGSVNNNIINLHVVIEILCVLSNSIMDCSLSQYVSIIQILLDWSSEINSVLFIKRSTVSMDLYSLFSKVIMSSLTLIYNHVSSVLCALNTLFKTTLEDVSKNQGKKYSKKLKCDAYLSSVILGSRNNNEIASRLFLNDLNMKHHIGLDRRVLDSILFCKTRLDELYGEDCNENGDIGSVANLDMRDDILVGKAVVDSAKVIATANPLDELLCTFAATQKEFTEQHWYHCFTCKMVDNEGVCSICARVCHKGHDLAYSKKGSFFCDCGAKGPPFCTSLTRRVTKRNSHTATGGSASGKGIGKSTPISNQAGGVPGGSGGYRGTSVSANANTVGQGSALGSRSITRKDRHQLQNAFVLFSQGGVAGSSTHNSGLRKMFRALDPRHSIRTGPTITANTTSATVAGTSAGSMEATAITGSSSNAVKGFISARKNGAAGSPSVAGSGRNITSTGMLHSNNKADVTAVLGAEKAEKQGKQIAGSTLVSNDTCGNKYLEESKEEDAYRYWVTNNLRSRLILDHETLTVLLDTSSLLDDCFSAIKCINEILSGIYEDWAVSRVSEMYKAFVSVRDEYKVSIIEPIMNVGLQIRNSTPVSSSATVADLSGFPPTSSLVNELSGINSQVRNMLASGYLRRNVLAVFSPVSASSNLSGSGNNFKQQTHQNEPIQQQHFLAVAMANFGSGRDHHRGTSSARILVYRITALLSQLGVDQCSNSTISQTNSNYRLLDPETQPELIEQVCIATLPYIALSMSVNTSANHQIMCVCGLRETTLLTFTAQGSVSAKVPIRPILEDSTQFIVKSMWLPGNTSHLVLVLTQSIQIFDVSCLVRNINQPGDSQSNMNVRSVVNMIPKNQQPIFHFKSVEARFKDATFVFIRPSNDTTKQPDCYILVMSDSGCIHCKKLDKNCVGSSGFYLAEMLDWNPELFSMTRDSKTGVLGKGGASIHYDHGLQLLFHSYNNGQTFCSVMCAGEDDLFVERNFVISVSMNDDSSVSTSSQSGSQQGNDEVDPNNKGKNNATHSNLVTLVNWTSLSYGSGGTGQPGMLSAMSQSNNLPFYLMVEPTNFKYQFLDSKFVIQQEQMQEMLDAAATDQISVASMNKVTDSVTFVCNLNSIQSLASTFSNINYQNDICSRAVSLVLYYDGRIAVVINDLERGQYWLQQKFTNMYLYQCLEGSGGSNDNVVDDSLLHLRSAKCQTQSTLLSSPTLISTKDRIFLDDVSCGPIPVDYFEHCEDGTKDITFGGDRLLELYSEDVLNNRLRSSESPVTVVCKNPFHVTMYNRRSDSTLIVGIRVGLCGAESSKNPKYFEINGRIVNVPDNVTNNRFIDIGLYKSEMLQNEKTFTLTVGPSRNANEMTVIDQILVFVRPRSSLAWLKNSNAMKSNPNNISSYFYQNKDNTRTNEDNKIIVSFNQRLTEELRFVYDKCYFQRINTDVNQLEVSWKELPGADVISAGIQLLTSYLQFKQTLQVQEKPMFSRLELPMAESLRELTSKVIVSYFPRDVILNGAALLSCAEFIIDNRIIDLNLNSLQDNKVACMMMKTLLQTSRDTIEEITNKPVNPIHIQRIEAAVFRLCNLVRCQELQLVTNGSHSAALLTKPALELHNDNSVIELIVAAIKLVVCYHTTCNCLSPIYISPQLQLDISTRKINPVYFYKLNNLPALIPLLINSLLQLTFYSGTLGQQSSILSSNIMEFMIDLLLHQNSTISNNTRKAVSHFLSLMTSTKCSTRDDNYCGKIINDFKKSERKDQKLKQEIYLSNRITPSKVIESVVENITFMDEEENEEECQRQLEKTSTENTEEQLESHLSNQLQNNVAVDQSIKKPLISTEGGNAVEEYDEDEEDEWMMGSGSARTGIAIEDLEDEEEEESTPPLPSNLGGEDDAEEEEDDNEDDDGDDDDDEDDDDDDNDGGRNQSATVTAAAMSDAMSLLQQLEANSDNDNGLGNATNAEVVEAIHDFIQNVDEETMMNLVLQRSLEEQQQQQEIVCGASSASAVDGSHTTGGASSGSSSVTNSTHGDKKKIEALDVSGSVASVGEEAESVNLNNIRITEQSRSSVETETSIGKAHGSKKKHRSKNKEGESISGKNVGSVRKSTKGGATSGTGERFINNPDHEGSSTESNSEVELVSPALKSIPKLQSVSLDVDNDNERVHKYEDKVIDKTHNNAQTLCRQLLEAMNIRWRKLVSSISDNQITSNSTDVKDDIVDGKRIQSLMHCILNLLIHIDMTNEDNTRTVCEMLSHMTDFIVKITSGKLSIIGETITNKDCFFSKQHKANLDHLMMVLLVLLGIVEEASDKLRDKSQQQQRQHHTDRNNSTSIETGTVGESTMGTTEANSDNSSVNNRKQAIKKLRKNSVIYVTLQEMFNKNILNQLTLSTLQQVYSYLESQTENMSKADIKMALKSMWSPTLTSTESKDEKRQLIDSNLPVVIIELLLRLPYAVVKLCRSLISSDKSKGLKKQQISQDATETEENNSEKEKLQFLENLLYSISRESQWHTLLCQLIEMNIGESITKNSRGLLTAIVGTKHYRSVRDMHLLEGGMRKVNMLLVNQDNTNTNQINYQNMMRLIEVLDLCISKARERPSNWRLFCNKVPGVLGMLFKTSVSLHAVEPTMGHRMLYLLYLAILESKSSNTTTSQQSHQTCDSTSTSQNYQKSSTSNGVNYSIRLIKKLLSLSEFNQEEIVFQFAERYLCIEQDDGVRWLAEALLYHLWSVATSTTAAMMQSALLRVWEKAAGIDSSRSSSCHNLQLSVQLCDMVSYIVGASGQNDKPNIRRSDLEKQLARAIVSNGSRLLLLLGQQQQQQQQRFLQSLVVATVPAVWWCDRCTIISDQQQQLQQRQQYRWDSEAPDSRRAAAAAAAAGGGSNRGGPAGLLHHYQPSCLQQRQQQSGSEQQSSNTTIATLSPEIRAGSNVHVFNFRAPYVVHSVTLRFTSTGLASRRSAVAALAAHDGSVTGAATAMCTVALYYSDSSTVAASQMLDSPHLWRHIFTQALVPRTDPNVSSNSGNHTTELLFQLPIPVTAVYLVFEYNLGVNSVSSGGMSGVSVNQLVGSMTSTSSSSHSDLLIPKCPRCHSSSIQGSVCLNCRENINQCYRCRAINYAGIDSFICSSCSSCRYGKIDFNMCAKPCYDFEEKIHSEEGREVIMSRITCWSELIDKNNAELKCISQEMEELIDQVKLYDADDVRVMQKVKDRKRSVSSQQQGQSTSTGTSGSKPKKSSQSGGTGASGSVKIGGKSFAEALLGDDAFGMLGLTGSGRPPYTRRVRRPAGEAIDKQSGNSGSGPSDGSTVANRDQVPAIDLTSSSGTGTGQGGTGNVHKIHSALIQLTNKYHKEYMDQHMEMSLLWRQITAAKRSVAMYDNKRTAGTNKSEELVKNDLEKQVFQENIPWTVNWAHCHTCLLQRLEMFVWMLKGLLSIPVPEFLESDVEECEVDKVHPNITDTIEDDNESMMSALLRLLLGHLLNVVPSNLRRQFIMLSALSTRNRPAQVSVLNELVCRELLPCITNGYISSDITEKRIKWMLSVLRASIAGVMDRDCWELRLRPVIKVLHQMHQSSVPLEVIKSIVLPCLSLLQAVMTTASTITTDSNIGKQTGSSANLGQEHVSHQKITMIDIDKWLMTENDSILKEWRQMNQSVILVRKYTAKWKQKVLGRRTTEPATNQMSTSANAVQQLPVSMLDCKFERGGWLPVLVMQAGTSNRGYDETGSGGCGTYLALLESVVSLHAGRLVVLSILARMLDTDNSCIAKTGAAFLLRQLSRERDWRFFLVVKTRLISIIERTMRCTLTELKSYERIGGGLSGSNSSEVLAAGLGACHLLRSIALLILHLLEVHAIATRHRESLLRSLLSLTLTLRHLVIFRSHTTAELEATLNRTVDSLSKHSEDAIRGFIKIAVNVMQDFPVSDLHSAGYIIDKINAYVCPRDYEHPVFDVVLDIFKGQEDFLPHRMINVTLSCQQFGRRPTVSDVVNFVARENGLASDVRLDLICDKKVLKGHLLLEDVYQHVWMSGPGATNGTGGSSSTHQQRPMRLTIRIVGLVEDNLPYVETLRRDVPMEHYRRANQLLVAITDFHNGLDLVLQRMGAVDELGRGATVISAGSRLLRYFVQVPGNDLALLNSDGIKVLLYCLVVSLRDEGTLDKKRRQEFEEGTIIPLIELLCRLLIMARKVVSDDSIGNEDTKSISLQQESVVKQQKLTIQQLNDQVGGRNTLTLAWLLDLVLDNSCKASLESFLTDLYQGHVAAVIPLLILRNHDEKMDLLMTKLDPHFQLLVEYEELTERQCQQLKCCCRIISSVPLDADGSALRNRMIQSVNNISTCWVNLCINFLLKGAPPGSLDTHPEGWRMNPHDNANVATFLARPGLPFVLELGQACVGSDKGSCGAAARSFGSTTGLLRMLHRLEQAKATPQNVSVLAEDLLTCLANCGVFEVANEVTSLREASQVRQRARVREVRQKQLAIMRQRQQQAIAAGGHGVSAVEQTESGTTEGAIGGPDTSGLSYCCAICQEGHRSKPGDLLGIYTFVRKCHVHELMAISPNGSGGNSSSTSGGSNLQFHTSVSSFVCVHFSCHTLSLKALSGSGESEWTVAQRHNQGAKCNTLLPLLGPNNILTTTETSSSTGNSSSSAPGGNSYKTNLTRYQTTVWTTSSSSGSGAAAESAFLAILHDIKFLLLRFGHNRPFNEETGGGARLSNMKLLPHLMQAALINIMPHSDLVTKETLALNNWVNMTKPVSTSSTSGTLSASSSGINNLVLKQRLQQHGVWQANNTLLRTVECMLLWSRSVWLQNRVVVLRLLVQHFYLRLISSSAGSSTSTLFGVTQMLPILIIWGILDRAFANGLLLQESIFSALETDSQSGHVEALSTHLRNKEGDILNCCTKMVRELEENWLPAVAAAGGSNSDEAIARLWQAIISTNEDDEQRVEQQQEIPQLPTEYSNEWLDSVVGELGLSM